MADVITSLFSGMTSAVSAITGSLKEAFENLLYVDPAAATPVISPLATFIFVIAGLGLAVSIVYFVLGKIKVGKLHK